MPAAAWGDPAGAGAVGAGLSRSRHGGTCDELLLLVEQAVNPKASRASPTIRELEA